MMNAVETATFLRSPVEAFRSEAAKSCFLPASELVGPGVLPCLFFESEIGECTFELAALFFKLLEPVNIRDFQTAELDLSLIIGG